MRLMLRRLGWNSPASSMRDGDAGQKHALEIPLHDRRQAVEPDRKHEHERFGGPQALNVRFDFASIGACVDVVKKLPRATSPGRTSPHRGRDRRRYVRRRAGSRQRARAARKRSSFPADARRRQEFASYAPAGSARRLRGSSPRSAEMRNSMRGGAISISRIPSSSTRSALVTRSRKCMSSSHDSIR